MTDLELKRLERSLSRSAMNSQAILCERHDRINRNGTGFFSLFLLFLCITL